MAIDLLDSGIFIAGHNGLVGSWILRELQDRGCRNLITRSRQELDLTRQSDVESFFAEQDIDLVFLAAARVGGILANDRFGGDFIKENLLIQTNVIDAAYRNGVTKLLFLGSSCIYPKLVAQPMREDDLLTGKLESTNEPYAVAKIAGMTMCRAYRQQFGFNAITALPTNLYGPGDHFDPDNSHFVPGMIRRFHDAKVTDQKTVTVWGTGKPRRELMHVRDAARACIHLMEHYDSGEPVNVGMGDDLSIQEIAELIRDTVGFQGELCLDTAKPDGTPRKLLDIARLRESGWAPTILPADGLAETYSWFEENGVNI